MEQYLQIQRELGLKEALQVHIGLYEQNRVVHGVTDVTDLVLLPKNKT